MALAHHDAAGRDQRAGGKAELVGAEQRADDDVAAGPQAAVDLQRDARAQPVQHQRLLRFGEPDFPRAAGMLDRGQRRSAGAAFIAGDGDVIGARLGDAGRNRADADFGDQLDRDQAGRVDVLQVVDQLRQILDRIDVVMRRRRDQADARRRMPHLGDGRVDLVAGQLAAFAGLGALRHLDLHHVGIDEIFGRDAEPARGDLLDRRALRIARAVGQRHVAIGLLAALAGVRLAADRVHGAGQRGVRLAADRAERHRARREPLDDLLGRLDLVERDRLAPGVGRHPDLEQAADGLRARHLAVHQLRIFAERLERALAHGMLQRRRRPPTTRHGSRRACGQRIFAAEFERAPQHRIVAERAGVAPRPSPRRSPPARRPRSSSRCR